MHVNDLLDLLSQFLLVSIAITFAVEELVDLLEPRCSLHSHERIDINHVVEATSNFVPVRVAFVVFHLEELSKSIVFLACLMKSHKGEAASLANIKKIIEDVHQICLVQQCSLNSLKSHCGITLCNEPEEIRLLFVIKLIEPVVCCKIMVFRGKIHEIVFIHAPHTTNICGIGSEIS